jgi:hypothetical protein
MAWVVIQKATETSWADYEKVAREVGDEPPPGLIVHAAGEENGRWRGVDVWESEEAYNRFRDERLLPAVKRALGEAALAQGPPPSESFEVRHLVQR